MVLSKWLTLGGLTLVASMQVLILVGVKHHHDSALDKKLVAQQASAAEEIITLSKMNNLVRNYSDGMIDSAAVEQGAKNTRLSNQQALFLRSEVVNLTREQHSPAFLKSVYDVRFSGKFDAVIQDVVDQIGGAKQPAPQEDTAIVSATLASLTGIAILMFILVWPRSDKKTNGKLPATMSTKIGGGS